MDKILEVDAHYYHLIGMRSGGKSYAVKEYVLKRFLEHGEEFVYIRRLVEHVKPVLVRQYWADMIPLIKKLTKDEYDYVDCRSGIITLVKLNNEGKPIKSQRMGYAMAISHAERYKSASYPDVHTVIFEEYLSLGEKYIAHEVDLFESIISTISRRDKIRVFMVGNKMSRTAPYFQHYQLSKVLKQKGGTIDIYKTFTDPPQFDNDGNHIAITHAVEITEELSQNTNMFAGHSQKAISNDVWVSQEQPRITLGEEHEKLYSIVFKYRQLMFVADFIFDNNTSSFFWYVTPKTKPYIKKGQRVISDIITNDPLYSNALIALTEYEIKMFEHFRLNKVYYATNLCGTEFKECLNYFRGNSYR